MLSRVSGFDLPDAVSKRVIAWARLSELAVNLERELFVTLLEIELCHRLVHKWFSARATRRRGLRSLIAARRRGLRGLFAARRRGLRRLFVARRRGLRSLIAARRRGLKRLVLAHRQEWRRHIRFRARHAAEGVRVVGSLARQSFCRSTCFWYRCVCRGFSYRIMSLQACRRIGLRGWRG